MTHEKDSQSRYGCGVGMEEPFVLISASVSDSGAKHQQDETWQIPETAKGLNNTSKKCAALLAIVFDVVHFPVNDSRCIYKQTKNINGDLRIEEQFDYSIQFD